MLKARPYKGRSVLTSRRPEGGGVLFGQMECFLAVARLGNLSRAAEEMFPTQPKLTGRLKAVEEEVGDQLFVRTSRGMRLTEAGKEFLPYAERCVGSFEEGRQHLEELRGASGGRRPEDQPPTRSAPQLLQMPPALLEAPDT